MISEAYLLTQVGAMAQFNHTECDGALSLDSKVKA